MKKLWWLLSLAGCGHSTAEQHSLSQQAALGQVFTSRYYGPSQGIENGEAPNGLQLVSITDTDAVIAWERYLTNWEPGQIRWLSNKVVAIEQRRFSANGTERITYVRLVLP